MQVIVDVLIEMGSIIFMGIIFFTLYVNGELLLMKASLIDKEQDYESIKEDVSEVIR